MNIICMTNRHVNPERICYMYVDEKGERGKKNSYKNVLFNQHPLLASIINSVFIMFLGLCRMFTNVFTCKSFPSHIPLCICSLSIWCQITSPTNIRHNWCWGARGAANDDCQLTRYCGHRVLPSRANL